jgi:hypothetical protein
MFNYSEENMDNFDLIVEECLIYNDYTDILNNNFFQLQSIDKYFYENIARDSEEVYKNFQIWNSEKEIQLNIEFNEKYKEKSIDTDKLDLINLSDFIPAFSYLKRLIIDQDLKNKYINEKIFYLKEDKYLFLMREKNNICKTVDYTYCEEEDFSTGRVIINPPFHSYEEWRTYYLVNAFEINPNMNEEEIKLFLKN